MNTPKLQPNPEWKKATHNVWFPQWHPRPPELGGLPREHWEKHKFNPFEEIRIEPPAKEWNIPIIGEKK